ITCLSCGSACNNLSLRSSVSRISNCARISRKAAVRSLMRAHKNRSLSSATPYLSFAQWTILFATGSASKKLFAVSPMWLPILARTLLMLVGDHNVSSSVPLISSDPVHPNKKSVLANIGNHIGETANNFLEALPVANRIVHWANERYGVAEERDRFLCARINDLTAALRDILAQFDIRETEDLKLKLLQADPHERQVIYQNILKELILKAIL